MLFQREYDEALNYTEKLFHMNEKKRLLEEYFAKKN
jgi:glyceraldehyde-3-phosphate dehydrogenase (NAD(P))